MIMLAQERLDTIMELLKQNKYLTVDFLVKELNYSPATIRRDISALVKAGYAKRSYGGISLAGRSKSVIVRDHEQVADKSAICKYAATLINDYDTVFIVGSSTVRHLLKHLQTKKNITVVTNDINLALDISLIGIKCYCTGGLVNDGMLTGFYAINTASKINYDICFFSASGISSDGEITVISEECGTLIQNLINRSKKSVCLCTANKFNKSEFFSICNTDCVTNIITYGTNTDNFTKKIKNCILVDNSK